MGEESQYTPCEGQQLFLVPGSDNKGRSCVDSSGGGAGTLQPFHPQPRDLSREDLNVKAEAQELLGGGGRTPFCAEATLPQSIPEPALRSANTPIQPDSQIMEAPKGRRRGEDIQKPNDLERGHQ